ncbi:hypothetical protein H5410_007930 [Solanum commersonii]|uniref:Uncharacterized protein n=1 Tax=Solanum commersonii TaxID=4109 RepID=A0A9J6ADT5_SOLCO|nr:hypothetical protein H5410_007930 [Solanum commersonii]
MPFNRLWKVILELPDVSIASSSFRAKTGLSVSRKFTMFWQVLSVGSVSVFMEYFRRAIDIHIELKSSYIWTHTS